MDQGTEGSLGQLLTEGDFSCDGIPAGPLVEGGSSSFELMARDMDDGRRHTDGRRHIGGGFSFLT